MDYGLKAWGTNGTDGEACHHVAAWQDAARVARIMRDAQRLVRGR